MSNDTNYDSTVGCEGSGELNGEGASFRGAKMVSDPRTVRKIRIRGALVPLPRLEQ
jgi:hypothetical protein